MRISEITPDQILAELLDDRIIVRTSATQSHTLKAYSENAQPNIRLDDEFIRLYSNGSPRPESKGRDGFGLWGGNVLIEILCKSNPDNTIKRRRNDSLIAQIEEVIGGGISLGRFFFWLDEDNPVTPPVPNLTNGYYTTVLNVKWRNRPNEK